ncbi:hypothetical protein [Paraferrimonas sedimenticola]|uniref:Uncharacterized protein n=1 Tax=Paraferrimonas sedimenticola TaxID=375674 RepID=A0AA37RV01_9GAMM|nr:hypothetical protein [Paraferrimonas sedimenticola]GLP95312.1 hypothetical protein GCM10007895_06180 [Paraferrimonas sedimenticola]
MTDPKKEPVIIDLSDPKCCLVITNEKAENPIYIRLPDLVQAIQTQIVQQLTAIPELIGAGLSMDMDNGIEFGMGILGCDDEGEGDTEFGFDFVGHCETFIDELSEPLPKVSNPVEAAMLFEEQYSDNFELLGYIYNGSCDPELKLDEKLLNEWAHLESAENGELTYTMQDKVFCKIQLKNFRYENDDKRLVFIVDFQAVDPKLLPVSAGEYHYGSTAKH